jgi:hypothetical protein
MGLSAVDVSSSPPRAAPLIERERRSRADERGPPSASLFDTPTNTRFLASHRNPRAADTSPTLNTPSNTHDVSDAGLTW